LTSNKGKNILTIAVAVNYAERISRLRERKLAQTAEKKRRNGYMNADDHGLVPAPLDFKWEAVSNHPNGGFYGFKGWGDNYRSLLDAHPTYVDPDDALAGRYMFYLSWMQHGGWKPEFDFSFLHEEQNKYGIVHGIGGPQHFAPDLQMGLELGWGGLLQKIRHFRAQHGPEFNEFYQAEEDIVVGIQGFIRRTIDAIKEAEAIETTPDLRDNLHEMAEVNSWLVENPARTMREACQWIAWNNMISRMFNGDGAGGQLDELLRPYYERDIATGIIDDEIATYYIACLLLNDPQYYQLSGLTVDGRDMTSRVSYLTLDAAHLISIPCNLTIRLHDDIDENFFQTAVKYLVKDRQAWPRFSGEKGLTEGFMRNGYSRDLARQRIAVGCHWMAIPGREYTLNDVVKINTGMVFDVALWEMLDNTAIEYSVETLWNGFVQHLERAVLCTAKGIDFHLAHQKDVNPELMLNLLCHGTIEQGRDATDGGVEFYNMCVDGSALAVVADSFAALDQRVEKEKVLTWEEVAKHLRSDYAGIPGERVRLMLSHSEKYGSGNSLGDKWALRISEKFTELVKAHPTPGGKNMIPGWFSWSNTIGMGKQLPATPNGRHSGLPISHGANPDPAFRKDGAPTAMVRAIAAIQPGYGNTAPVQMEIDPGVSRGDNGLRNVATLIRTHIDLGGTLFNINVINKEKILAAHNDPSLYPDLVVRVTGFTAFFASLSPEFRQLVVDRLMEG
jgi:pyruvate-formate lyase